MSKEKEIDILTDVALIERTKAFFIAAYNNSDYTNGNYSVLCQEKLAERGYKVCTLSALRIYNRNKDDMLVGAITMGDTEDLSIKKA